MRVEVDPETMQVDIQRYVVVHDCGVQINPMIVEGQIQGGVAHGIGNAFYEQLVFDDGGQLMNASLMDYLLPTALDVPTVEIGHIETPSPLNPIGAKGVGEAGAIPVGALFAQAVEDALHGTGLEITEIPLSPGRLFTLVEQAKHRGPRAPKAARAGRALVVSGTREFAGAAGDIYALLLDPQVIASVMPGTQRLERIGDRYEGALRIGIGPVSAARFDLVVTITNQSSPKSYAMHIEARGAPGFVTGNAEVRLSPGTTGHTRMEYRAELQLGGTLAAVGQRLLDSVSKVMSAQGLKALDRAMRERSAGARR